MCNKLTINSFQIFFQFTIPDLSQCKSPREWFWGWAYPQTRWEAPCFHHCWKLGAWNRRTQSLGLRHKGKNIISMFSWCKTNWENEIWAAWQALKWLATTQDKIVCCEVQTILNRNLKPSTSNCPYFCGLIRKKTW